jgi:hypothetical protein
MKLQEMLIIAAPYLLGKADGNEVARISIIAVPFKERLIQ